MPSSARRLQALAIAALLLATAGLFHSRRGLQQNLADLGRDLMQRDLRVRQLERELEASRQRSASLEETLRTLRSLSAQNIPSQPAVTAPGAAAELPGEPQKPEAVGRKASTPGTPAADDTERFRDHLAAQLEEAWLAGDIEDAEREEILGLLMKIRALKRTRPAGDEELIRVQEQFIAVTGVGVGEFLVQLDDSIERSRRPAEALEIQEGEQRKRFADELSRRLGIAEGGEVEQFENGEWKPSVP